MQSPYIVAKSEHPLCSNQRQSKHSSNDLLEHAQLWAIVVCRVRFVLIYTELFLQILIDRKTATILQGNVITGLRTLAYYQNLSNDSPGKYFPQL